MTRFLLNLLFTPLCRTYKTTLQLHNSDTTRCTIYSTQSPQVAGSHGAPVYCLDNEVSTQLTIVQPLRLPTQPLRILLTMN